MINEFHSKSMDFTFCTYFTTNPQIKWNINRFHTTAHAIQRLNVDSFANYNSNSYLMAEKKKKNNSFLFTNSHFVDYNFSNCRQQNICQIMRLENCPIGYIAKKTKNFQMNSFAFSICTSVSFGLRKKFTVLTKVSYPPNKFIFKEVFPKNLFASQSIVCALMNQKWVAYSRYRRASNAVNSRQLKIWTFIINWW